GIPDAGALIAPQGHDADQGDVPQPSLRRHGRARTEDHRRVHLQVAQEARECVAGQELHRDRLGPRLCAARADGSRRAHPRLTTSCVEPAWLPPNFGSFRTPPAMAGFSFGLSFRAALRASIPHSFARMEPDGMPPADGTLLTAIPLEGLGRMMRVALPHASRCP